MTNANKTNTSNGSESCNANLGEIPIGFSGAVGDGEGMICNPCSTYGAIIDSAFYMDGGKLKAGKDWFVIFNNDKYPSTEAIFASRQIAIDFYKKTLSAEQHDDDKLLADLGIDITKIKAEPMKSPVRSYADAVKFLSTSAGVKL